MSSVRSRHFRSVRKYSSRAYSMYQTPHKWRDTPPAREVGDDIDGLDQYGSMDAFLVNLDTGLDPELSFRQEVEW